MRNKPREKLLVLDCFSSSDVKNHSKPSKRDEFLSVELSKLRDANQYGSQVLLGLSEEIVEIPIFSVEVVFFALISDAGGANHRQRLESSRANLLCALNSELTEIVLRDKVLTLILRHRDSCSKMGD